MQIVAYILAIWSCTVTGVLIFFLWRVAYFYQKTSGQRVGQWLVFVPAVL